MIRKVLVILCAIILVHGGILGTDYSPATSVSYSSFSSTPVFKTIEPIVEKTQQIEYERTELSPMYESVFNTQENTFKTEDESEHKTFSKSLDIADSKSEKLDARTEGLAYSAPSFSAPVYTEAIYQSGSYSHESPISPIVQSLSTSLHQSPVYAVQTKPVTYVAPAIKSLPAYPISASPIVYNTKVTPGLSAYASPSNEYSPTLIQSHTSDRNQMKTYSDTHSTSHVTVSGSGTNYFW